MYGFVLNSSWSKFTLKSKRIAQVVKKNVRFNSSPPLFINPFCI